MTTAEARTAVKNRLNITLTTWDTQIDDFINSAVRRLYPRAKREIPSQNPSNFTIDSLGEVSLSLITDFTIALREARKIEVQDSHGWSRIDDTFHHEDVLTLRGIPQDTIQIRVFGLTNFTDIEQVYDWLLQAVIWYSMAEFYDFLAGNKKNYNAYLQSTGSRAVDNMADQSAYYDTKADRYLEEQTQNYGL